MLGSIPFAKRIGFDKAEFVGYTIMVLSFLMVFFGVRSYRENVGDGYITFRPRSRTFEQRRASPFYGICVNSFAWSLTSLTISDFKKISRRLASVTLAAIRSIISADLVNASRAATGSPARAFRRPSSAWT